MYTKIEQNMYFNLNTIINITQYFIFSHDITCISFVDVGFIDLS